MPEQSHVAALGPLQPPQGSNLVDPGVVGQAERLLARNLSGFFSTNSVGSVYPLLALFLLYPLDRPLAHTR